MSGFVLFQTFLCRYSGKKHIPLFTSFPLLIVVLCFSQNIIGQMPKQDLSFSSNAKVGNNSPAKEDSTHVNMISKELHILFLENKSGNSQLARLLEGRGKKKIVLQFYTDKDGNLGLKAWPGKRKNKKFVVGDAIKLSDTKEIGTRINNEEVYLADLQLGKETTKTLRKKINKPGRQNDTNFNYILFIPTIKPDSKTGDKYVIYQIVGATGPLKAQSTLQEIMWTNPSPPRAVDEDVKYQ